MRVLFCVDGAEDLYNTNRLMVTNFGAGYGITRLLSVPVVLDRYHARGVRGCRGRNDIYAFSRTWLTFGDHAHVPTVAVARLVFGILALVLSLLLFRFVHVHTRFPFLPSFPRHPREQLVHEVYKPLLHFGKAIATNALETLVFEQLWCRWSLKAICDSRVREFP